MQIHSELDKIGLNAEKKLQAQTDVITDINILAGHYWNEIQLVMGEIEKQGPNQPSSHQQVFLTADDIAVSLRYSKIYSPEVKHHQVDWGVIELCSNQTPVDDLVTKLKARIVALGSQNLK